MGPLALRRGEAGLTRLPTNRGALLVALGHSREAPAAAVPGAKRGGHAGVLLVDNAALATPPSEESPDLPVLRANVGQEAVRSALVSRGSPPIRLATVPWGPEQITLLVRDDAAGRSVVAAAVSRANATAPGLTVIHWGGQGGADLGMPDAYVLERLYELVLRQHAEHAFEFRSAAADAAGRRAAATRPMSQGDLLRLLAQARECIIARAAASQASAVPRWRVATIEFIAPRAPAADAGDFVSVSVRNAMGPIRGANVSFSRDPHMACSAVTDDAGVAACRLWDTHGHDGHDGHEHEAAAHTVATFSGVVTQDVIDLPTSSIGGRRAQSGERGQVGSRASRSHRHGAASH